MRDRLRTNAGRQHVDVVQFEMLRIPRLHHALAHSIMPKAQRAQAGPVLRDQYQVER